MQPLIAYILTLVTIPVVGLFAGLLTLPLVPALVDYSKAYWFIAKAFANTARCVAAWGVFYMLGASFGIGPMLMVGVCIGLMDAIDVNRRLTVYTVYLHGIGLGPDSGGAAINLARRSDEKFQELHAEVGDSIAGLVGGLIGIAVSIWVWVSMNGAA